jgi:hypothetical protein
MHAITAGNLRNAHGGESMGGFAYTAKAWAKVFQL